ncbi:MAG: hypothetical protein M1833_003046 [Piccolia ochrophora]|nr:MAG: hypothetical protein M1833_003046 [Piccolia ochrophora]
MFGHDAMSDGQHIDRRYRKIINLVAGAGDQGCWNEGIYLVQNRRSGVFAVQKILKSEDVAFGSAELEIRILRDLRHRHVVTYVDAFLDTFSYTASLFTEYCDLGTLDELIARFATHRRLIPEDFIWHVFTSLIEGLVYCHTGHTSSNMVSHYTHKPGWLTVLHRDLKAGNIFLQTCATSPFPQVKLGDFGMAIRADNPMFHDTAYAGAITVMPPETPKFSEQGDVWGVGVNMQVMCRLDEGPLVPRPFHYDVRDWFHHPHAFQPRGAGHNYSPTLNAAVDLCQQMLRRDRPRALDLAIWMRGVTIDVKTRPLPSWALPLSGLYGPEYQY